MVEALVALALTSMILAALASVTGQWLPNWKAGISRLQSSESFYLGLGRAAADLAAAEFISPSSESRRAYFRGSPTSVAFVRSAIGPNSPGGLEIVRLRGRDDGDGLVREAAPFATSGPTGAAGGIGEFGGAAALMGPAFRVTFAFAGRDRKLRDVWNGPELPTAVRILVRGAGSGKILSVSTAALVHVGAPGECASANSAWGCIQELHEGAGAQAPGTERF